MQHPVGYEDGRRQGAADQRVGAAHEQLRGHRLDRTSILAGLIFGSMVMFGISCWHLLRGRNVELFRRAAKLALIVAVPATLIQLSVGNRFGEAVTERAGHEDRRLRGAVEHLRAVRLLALPDRRVLGAGPRRRASRSRSRSLLSWMATGSFNGKVEGLNQLQQQEQQSYGPGNYMPNVRLMYWSMRVMAMLGVAMFLIAAVGAWLYRKRKLHTTRWFLWIAVVAMSFPYIAATAGWILTEMGRQPWIVQNLLKTSDAVSTGLSTATVAISLTVFVLLYAALGVVDFVLMRRYARLDPPPLREQARAGTAHELLEPRWTSRLLVRPDRRPLERLLPARGVRLRRRMLLPMLPRDERERGLMFESIGPVWDGNEVWLVVAAGATFAAFPAWYATMFSGFYVALLLILVLLIVRVVSFEWREKHDRPALAGDVAVGEHDRQRRAPPSSGESRSPTSSHGVPLDSSHVFTGGISTCSAPTPWLAGLAVVAMFALHGATYLTLRTDGDLRERASRTARRLAVPAIIARRRRCWHGRCSSHTTTTSARILPTTIPAVLTAIALVLALCSTRTGRDGWAFAATGLARHRLHRDHLHRPLPAGARLGPDLRQQPDDLQRRDRALRAAGDHRRGGDLHAAHPALPGLDLPRVPRTPGRRGSGALGRRGRGRRRQPRRPDVGDGDRHDHERHDLHPVGAEQQRDEQHRGQREPRASRRTWHRCPWRWPGRATARGDARPPPRRWRR